MADDLRRPELQEGKETRSNSQLQTETVIVERKLENTNYKLIDKEEKEGEYGEEDGGAGKYEYFVIFQHPQLPGRGPVRGLGGATGTEGRLGGCQIRGSRTGTHLPAFPKSNRASQKCFVSQCLRSQNNAKTWSARHFFKNITNFAVVRRSKVAQDEPPP